MVLPALIDGAPAHELLSKHGDAVFAVFDLCEQLSIFQRLKLWGVGQSIAAPIGEELSPCGNIMLATRQSFGRVLFVLVTLQCSLGSPDKHGELTEGSTGSWIGWR